jgi:two-component system response regulator FixJ
MSVVVTIFVVSGDPKAETRFGELLGASNLRTAIYDSPASLLEDYEADAGACVVLDLRWPWRRDGNGGAAGGLRLCQIESPVVFVSGPRDESLRSPAVRTDLMGNVVPIADARAEPPTLLAAIEWAAKHHLRLRDERSRMAEVAHRLRSLTRREQEVMTMVVDGMSNRQIADRLGISSRTIEIHRARVMEKMGAHSLSDLVRMACYRSVQVGRPEPRPDGHVVRVAAEVQPHGLRRKGAG